MDELQRLKKILSKEGVKGKDLARLLGIRYNSYRTMTATNAKSIPKWVKAFVAGWTMAMDPDLICMDCGVNDNGHGKHGLYCEECHKSHNQQNAAKFKTN